MSTEGCCARRYSNKFIRGDLRCDGQAVKGCPHIRGSVNEKSLQKGREREGRKEKGRERDKAVNQGLSGCKGCAPRTF